MAMEMDGCFLCHTAKLKLNDISSKLKDIILFSNNLLNKYEWILIILERLKCSQNENKCSKKMMLDGNYSKPILLQVINNLNSKSLYLYTS